MPCERMPSIRSFRSKHSRSSSPSWISVSYTHLDVYKRQVERRLSECLRLGFATCVIPRENLRRIRVPEGMKVYGVDTVSEAIAILIG